MCKNIVSYGRSSIITPAYSAMLLNSVCCFLIYISITSTTVYANDLTLSTPTNTEYYSNLSITYIKARIVRLKLRRIVVLESLLEAGLKRNVNPKKLIHMRNSAQLKQLTLTRFEDVLRERDKFVEKFRANEEWRKLYGDMHFERCNFYRDIGLYYTAISNTTVRNSLLIKKLLTQIQECFQKVIKLEADMYDLETKLRNEYNAALSEASS